MKKLLIIITMIGIVTYSISQNQPNKKNNMKKVEKTEAEWKAELTEFEYYVTREKGTERAFTGEFNENKKKGIYTCRCCQTALFSSEAKYDSGSGWPSFYAPFNENNVNEITDKSHGMVRTEVTCNVCDAHLGHVFTDGPKPTGLRYCINSISLDFEEK